MTPEEVRAARAILGLSQAALARLLYSDIRTVRRWENGERAVPGPAVVALQWATRERSLPHLPKREEDPP